MSILEPLLRFIDINTHRLQQEERRRQREAIPPDFDPDELDTAPDAAPTVVRELVCKVCHERGVGRYCMTCLAETMVAP